jgi:hypothetical protein
VNDRESTEGDWQHIRARIRPAAYEIHEPGPLAPRARRNRRPPRDMRADRCRRGARERRPRRRGRPATREQLLSPLTERFALSP